MSNNEPPNQTALPPDWESPNKAVIDAIADHYVIQRDPRRTAKILGEVSMECARRLCEGHVLDGGSLECYVAHYSRDDFPNLTRKELVDAAAGIIEAIAIWDRYHIEPAEVAITNE